MAQTKEVQVISAGPPQEGRPVGANIVATKEEKQAGKGQEGKEDPAGPVI